VFDVLTGAVDAEGCELLGRIDGATGAVQCVDAHHPGRVAVEGAADIEVEVASEAVNANVAWFRDASMGGGDLAVITFSGLRTALDQSRSVEVDWTTDTVEFVPAGSAGALARVPLSVFEGAEEPVGIPLPGGVLGLGGDRWLVVDPRTVGVAARIHPDQAFVAFEDDTRALEDTDVWELWFVDGEAEALALAERLAVTPDVTLYGTPIGAPPVDETGCECGTVSPSSATPGWALVCLVILARRRRG